MAGVGPLKMVLRRAGKGYVLRVNRNSEFHSSNKPPLVYGSVEEVAAGLDEADQKRLSASPCTKGPRLCNWVYFETADLNDPAFRDGFLSRWTCDLLICRNIADGALAYFSTWYSQRTSIETLVLVEGHRWLIEDDFETSKNEFGLDHNETRF